MWNRLLLLKVQLLSHGGIRRYGANTAWLMGEKVLRMFMGLFVGIWVARYLGPEQFGLLSYAQSFVFLFTAIATLGLDSIVVRELVKDNSQRNVLLGTAFVLKLIGSLCILPLLWFGVQFTSNDSYTNLLIFIIASGTIFQSFNVIDFYYQSSVLSKYVAFANTITLAISSIIKIVLILNQSSLLAFAIVGVFDTVILSLGLIYFYLQKTQHSLREWRFDKVVAKRLLKDSFPLIIVSLLTVIYARIDQIMIKELLGSYEVGLFSASVRITEAWLFVPVVIANSVFPSIITSRNITNLYKTRLRALYQMVIFIGLSVALIVSLTSSSIIELMYGTEYIDGSNVLAIRIWETLFAAIGTVVAKWIIAENLQSKSIIFVFYGAITNLVANYILIPKIGIEGAAVSSLLSIIMTVILIPLCYKSFRSNTIIILKSFNPIRMYLDIKNRLNN